MTEKDRWLTRNFALLLLGQLSSLMGNYILKFALSMYVLEQTGSASVFSGMLALAMVPTILLSPFGGILSDRANRRNIMAALDALSGITVLAASLFFSSDRDIWVIGGVLLVLSVLGAFESPTVQACVPQMLSGEHVLKGNAAVSQIQAVTSLVTPFLGSLFYTAFGLRRIFYVTMACFFVTAFLESFIHLEYQKPEKKANLSTVVKEDLARSVRFLCREETSVLKLLLLAAGVSMFVVGIITVGFPYLVRTVMGLSAQYYGAAESAMGIAAVLGSIAAGFLAERLKTFRLHLLIAAVGICLIPAGIVFFLPLGVIGKYAVLLLMFCGCQMLCSIFSIYALSAIQERTPQNLTGKVMACVYTLSMCVQPVGQLLYGFLFDKFSQQVQWILVPSGLLVCSIGAAAAVFFKKLKMD